MATELLKTLLETEKTMNMDERDQHPNVRGAWAIRRREARDQYPGLWQKFRDSVMAKTSAVFVKGTQAEVNAFAAVADEGCVVVRAADMYERMAKLIEPALGQGSRQVLPQHVNMVFDCLRDISAQLGVDLDPRITNLPVLPDYDDVVEFCRVLVRQASGDAANRVRIMEEIATRCKASDYDGGMVPVVVVGTSDEEEVGLGQIFNRVLPNYRVKGEVTKDTVMKVFKEAKKRVTKDGDQQEGGN